jgi:hypothetical protein
MFALFYVTLKDLAQANVQACGFSTKLGKKLTSSDPLVDHCNNKPSVIVQLAHGDHRPMLQRSVISFSGRWLIDSSLGDRSVRPC